MSNKSVVSEPDFPSAGTNAEILRFLVNYAILAPSSHNTQPWLFRIGERSLELIADRTRALPVVDPNDRALTISCGAALLAVFGTGGDDPNDWLAAGRALSRVLLKLTASGATAAFLNQPIEVERLRPRLADAIGTSTIPQLLMRFGYGEAANRSVRRPVEDVLI